jgi:cyanophycinase-like exopeptidase
VIANLSFPIPYKGWLALAGSGEYLPGMIPVDRFLMDQLGQPARVVCLPTAAGTEGSERIQYWSNLGSRYFSAIGAASAQSLPVTDRAGAMDESLAEKVHSANFVYLSGGKPNYLYATLAGSPVWQAILDVLAHGGVVAGCSAGAMIFGENMFSIRLPGSPMTGFGMLPQTVIIPHFDELPGVASSSIFLTAGKKTVIGIEGYTSLVCSAAGCQVIGKGGVTVSQNGQRQRYMADNSNKSLLTS